MKLKEISFEELEKFSLNTDEATFHQTKGWAKLKEHNGWKHYVVGLAMKSYIDNDNEILLTTYKDDSKKVIKSSELIEIIEARIEEIFSLVNKDITTKGIKSRINNVVLTGQGITTISKSDVAGKIILNIPVKVATGRLVSTIKPEYRTAYSLVRYIASKPFVRTVSSSIDTDSKENIFKNIAERIKEFFYS